MMYCPKTKRYFATTGGWWPCELQVLTSLHRDNYNMNQMAEVLDRSWFSVRTKLVIMGLHQPKKVNWGKL